MKTNMSARVHIALGALVFTLLATPNTTHAVRDLKELINEVITYFNYATYLIIGLATVIFVWNVYQLYFKPDADRTEAGKYVLYSVIGFFVMLSFWGLVNLISNTLDLDTEDPTQPFSIDGSGSGVGTFGGGIGPARGTVNTSPGPVQGTVNTGPGPARGTSGGVGPAQGTNNNTGVGNRPGVDVGL